MPLISENLAAARGRLAAAAAAAGRDAADVTLVAVTKYATAEQVEALLAAGARDLGENRPLQLVERAETYAATPGVRWHQIGQVQRNKARKLLPAVSLIHSVDSEKLLTAIDRAAGDDGPPVRVLLQANVTGEASKSGFAPDDLRELWDRGVDRFAHVEVQGLMTMAPLAETPAEIDSLARPAFAALRALRDELGGPGRLPVLSMGMSGDFEAAIAEGSTCVRLGSALLAGS